MYFSVHKAENRTIPNKNDKLLKKKRDKKQRKKTKKKEKLIFV